MYSSRLPLLQDTALADRLRFNYLGEGALGPQLDKQMMQLASDTMYQAGTKTLLDLVLQQDSSHNVYQVRNYKNHKHDDNMFSTCSRMWAPSPSLSSGTEPTGPS